MEDFFKRYERVVDHFVLIEYDEDVIPFSLGEVFLYLHDHHETYIRIKDYYVGISEFEYMGLLLTFLNEQLDIIIEEELGRGAGLYYIEKGERAAYLEKAFLSRYTIITEKLKKEIVSSFDPNYKSKKRSIENKYISHIKDVLYDKFQDFGKVDARFTHPGSLVITCDAFFDSYEEIGNFYLDVRNSINNMKIAMQPDIDFGEYIYHFEDINFNVKADLLIVHLTIYLRFKSYTVEEFFEPEGVGYYKMLIDNVCDNNYKLDDLQILIDRFQLQDLEKDELCEALRYYYKALY